MAVKLKTTVSEYASVEAFDETAQSTFKENVAAASNLVESADDVVIDGVSETTTPSAEGSSEITRRRRALLAVSLDVDYTVTISCGEGDAAACGSFLASDVSAANIGTTSVEATSLVSSLAAPTGGICFTGDSLLTLEDGSTKKFRNLQVSAEREAAPDFSPSRALSLSLSLRPC